MTVAAPLRPDATESAQPATSEPEAATIGASPEPPRFEPNLLGFTCNWCSYRAADLAGTARMKYAPNMPLIRLMCAGRLDPTFVLAAFAHGADGVMISGCWPGDCHYREQNFKGLRRFQLLRRTLVDLGIEPERLQLVWASAAEGERLASEMTRIVEEVRALGPLRWRPPAAQVTDAAPEAAVPAAEAEAPAANAEAPALEAEAPA